MQVLKKSCFIGTHNSIHGKQIGSHCDQEDGAGKMPWTPLEGTC